MNDIYSVTGTVGDIQQFSVGDGPGIRTTVFLKGCNLKCKWCHNPEEISLRQNLLFYASLCTACGRCVSSCPENSIGIADGHKTVDRTTCKNCGVCVDSCTREALKLVGKTFSVRQVLDIVLEDMDFYKSSGGGVTLSGGEPLLQTDFCVALAQALHENNINVLIDTAANVPLRYFERVLPFADEFYVDVKAADEDTYSSYTDGSLSLTLENIRFLCEHNANVTVRIPIIPGIGDDPEFPNKVGKLILESGAEKVSILPFHSLCSSKYTAMGATYPYKGIRSPSKADMEKIRSSFPTELSVTVGG